MERLVTLLQTWELSSIKKEPRLSPESSVERRGVKTACSVDLFNCQLSRVSIRVDMGCEEAYPHLGDF